MIKFFNCWSSKQEAALSIQCSKGRASLTFTCRQLRPVLHYHQQRPSRSLQPEQASPNFQAKYPTKRETLQLRQWRAVQLCGEDPAHNCEEFFKEGNEEEHDEIDAWDALAEEQAGFIHIHSCAPYSKHLENS